MDLIITLWNAAIDTTHYQMVTLLEHTPALMHLFTVALRTIGLCLFEDGSIGG
jgi:hypothetical protein